MKCPFKIGDGRDCAIDLGVDCWQGRQICYFRLAEAKNAFFEQVDEPISNIRRKCLFLTLLVLAGLTALVFFFLLYLEIKKSFGFFLITLLILTAVLALGIREKGKRFHQLRENFKIFSPGHFRALEISGEWKW